MKYLVESYDSYAIYRVAGYYEVMKGSEFICTADTLKEAREEIKNEGQKEKLETALIYTIKEKSLMAKFKPVQQKPVGSGRTENGELYEIYEEFGFYSIYINKRMRATRKSIQQLEKFKSNREQPNR